MAKMKISQKPKKSSLLKPKATVKLNSENSKAQVLKDLKNLFMLPATLIKIE